jgi:hypothetical protein
VRGPHLVPLCPETYARSYPRVGVVRFAHWHSPQVINRNLRKNNWDKQGGAKILGPGAGRCATSWRRKLGECPAIREAEELERVVGVKA